MTGVGTAVLSAFGRECFPPACSTFISEAVFASLTRSGGNVKGVVEATEIGSSLCAARISLTVGAGLFFIADSNDSGFFSVTSPVSPATSGFGRWFRSSPSLSFLPVDGAIPTFAAKGAAELGAVTKASFDVLTVGIFGSTELNFGTGIAVGTFLVMLISPGAWTTLGSELHGGRAGDSFLRGRSNIRFTAGELHLL